MCLHKLLLCLYTLSQYLHLCCGLTVANELLFNKDFVDAERLLKEKREGSVRRLRGLKMLDRGVPRSGYNILNANGEIIGVLTSGTQSPTLGIGIGLGYIAVNQAKLGDHVYVEIRNKSIPAQVTKPGFLSQ